MGTQHTVARAARILGILSALVLAIAAWAVSPEDIAPDGGFGAGKYLEAGKAVVFDGKYWFFVRTPALRFELWVTDGTKAGTRAVVTDIDGMRQATTATVVSKCLANGTAKVTVTAAGVPGSPKTYDVALVASTDTDTSKVATKIHNVLNADATFKSLYTISRNGAAISYTTPVVITTPDTTLNIEIQANGTGIGDVTTSTNTSYADPSQITLGGVTGVTGFSPARNLLFFTGSRNDCGWELYATDGVDDTEAHTFLVKDIFPGGSPYLNSSAPRSLTAMGGKLYFTATTGNTAPGTGRELYVSDGTSDGTYMVQDINVGTADGLDTTNNPPQFSITTASDGTQTLFFVADNGFHGPELWRTNGLAATPSATWTTGKVTEGSGDYSATWTALKYAASSSDTGLFVTSDADADGPRAGNDYLQFTVPYRWQGSGNGWAYLDIGKLLTGRADGTVDLNGRYELRFYYKYAGVRAPGGLAVGFTSTIVTPTTAWYNALLLRQPVVATTAWQERRIPLSTSTTNPSTVQAVKYLAFAQTGDNLSACDICIDDVVVYDYATGNTTMVRDLGNVGSGKTSVKNLTAIEDKVYFQYTSDGSTTYYRDGVARWAEAGELMVSDGTYAGTTLLDRINSASPPVGSATGSNPSGFVVGPGGSEIYMAATSEGYGTELFRIGLGSRPASLIDTYWLPREPSERWSPVLASGCTAAYPATPTPGAGGTAPADSIQFTMTSSTYGQGAVLLNNAIPALDCSMGGTLHGKLLANSTSSKFWRLGLNVVESAGSSANHVIVAPATINYTNDVWADFSMTVPAGTYARIISFGIHCSNNTTYTGTYEYGGFRWVPNTGAPIDFPIGGSQLSFPWTSAAAGVAAVRDTANTKEGRASVAVTTSTAQSASIPLAEAVLEPWATSWTGATRLSCWARGSVAIGDGAIALRLWKNAAIYADVPLTTPLLSADSAWPANTWVFCEADIAAAMAHLGGVVNKIQVVQTVGTSLGTYTLWIDGIRTKNFDGARVCDMAVRGPNSASPSLVSVAGGLVAYRADNSTNFVATNGTHLGQEMYGYVPGTGQYVMLKDVRNSTGGSFTANVTAAGGAVVYTASNNTSAGHTEVYRSYVTAGGKYAARMIENTNTANNASGPVCLADLNGVLIYGHSTTQSAPNGLYAFDVVADTLTVSSVAVVNAVPGSVFARDGAGPFTLTLTLAGSGFDHAGTQTYTAALYRAGGTTAVAAGTGISAADNNTLTVTFANIAGANLPAGMYDIEVTVSGGTERTGDPAEFTRAANVLTVAVGVEPPVIANLIPNTGLTSETAKSLTLEGEGFGEDEGLVELVKRGTTTTLPLTDLMWTDTGITGTVNLTGKAGVWDVRVITADGRAATLGTLYDAVKKTVINVFTVTDASITTAWLSMNPSTWPVLQGNTITLSAWGQGDGTPVLHTCDSGWVKGAGASSVGHDANVVQLGTASTKVVVASTVAAGDVLATVNLGSNSVALTGATRIGYWLRLGFPSANSTTRLAANSLVLKLYTAGDVECASLPVDMDVYDRIWTRVTAETAALTADITRVSLVAGATPPPAGLVVTLDDIRWTDGASLQYRFRARSYNSATGIYDTVTLRDFAGAPSFAWTPSIVGPYWITAEVRQGTAAAAASPEVYTRIDSPTLTGVTLQRTGTGPYALTATKVGSATNVEYKFVVNRRITAAGVVPAKYTSYVVRDYATANTCTWDPATTGGSAAGTYYQVYVYARIQGSTSSLQVYNKPAMVVSF